jgi:hypothetical protein
MNEDELVVWWPQPKAGDICRCWTPQLKDPPHPGPNRHPALIVQVEQLLGYPDRFQVLIAPGTSKAERIFSGDIVIGNEPGENQAMKSAGLTKATKFQLDECHRVWLAYNSDYFECPAEKRTPVQGFLDLETPSIKRKLNAAKKAIGMS